MHPPLLAGATTFPPHWEACHWILSRLRLLANPVPLPPQAGALWVLSHGVMSLQGSIERFILSPGWGKVRRSRKGGGERSEPVSRMVILPYDADRLIRNADFISIAQRAIRNPRPEGPSNLRTLRPSGRSILRTFFRNPSTQPAAVRRPQPSGQSPSTLTPTERVNYKKETNHGI